MASSTTTSDLDQRTRTRVVQRSDLQALLDVLRRGGFRVVAPTVRDGAVMLGEIASVEELPAGQTDEQSGGHYRLTFAGDAVLGASVGPDSCKRFLFPPEETVFRAHRDGNAVTVRPPRHEAQATAFFGVRACDLAAMSIQDRVFLGGSFEDAGYAARRAEVFVVVAHCGRSSGTCFCASMGTGPRARSGFDLALAELLDDGGHRFVVEVGTERGAAVVADVPSRPATEADIEHVERLCASAAATQGRSLGAANVRELLLGNIEHPRWADVAKRCLTCGNCTLVCPTCFCSTVGDTTDITGSEAVRTRRWDSCFTLRHSYIKGGPVRSSAASRYRQWMTHKLATWHDQYGTSGCVGCGRCITWCPVGIDITEEVAAIRANPTLRRDSEGG